MGRFDGRVAVVTGGSRGIGRAIAEQLVREGARVCITGRKEVDLVAAVETLGGIGQAMAVAGKADDDDHREQAVAATVEAFGRLDMLVSNAGINVAYGRTIDIEPAAARKILEVNVLAALAWARECVAAGLGTSGPGSIVAVSSAAALLPSTGIGWYGASKAMLDHLTRQLAFELAPSIRVNSVAPAVVRTEFSAALYAGRDAEVAAEYPLGRLGTAADVAAAACFLLSDDAAWITGQSLVLDGGLTLKGGV